MTTLLEPAPVGAVLTFDRMLERIRYEGAYPTRERAEAVTRAVLECLGRRLPEDVRAELASRLPQAAAAALLALPAEEERLTGWGFVKDLSARTGGTPATARWDAGAVLGIVDDLAGPALVDRLLAALPPGYALLFGRAELLRVA